MNNMNMQIPNIGFQNQNMMMNNNILKMMNIMMNNQSVELNLIFEERNQKQTSISILPEKTIKEAIDLYKIKSGNNSQNFIYIHNGQKLNPGLKINQSDLVNGSYIYVIDTEEMMGG